MLGAAAQVAADGMLSPIIDSFVKAVTEVFSLGMFLSWQQ